MNAEHPSSIQVRRIPDAAAAAALHPCPPARLRRPDLCPRRGNTLVLVAGILVLLVIIATAYLTRTHGQRQTSTAQQSAAQRDDNAELIGRMIAREIAESLFVAPIDPDGSDPGEIVDANTPRLSPLAYEQIYDEPATRYNVDWDFPYNFAPYHIVPFTNWPSPDGLQIRPELWPAGPGNVLDPDAGTGFGNPAIAALLSAEHNPLGNPGFGDNRWLADIEPVRRVIPNTDIEAFSHWRKMTNLARANNAWRIVGDISDVKNSTVTNLNIPAEQWLLLPPEEAFINDDSGNVNFAALLETRFWNQWNAWLGFTPDGLGGYQQAYVNTGTGFPPNLYKLNDLNADGLSHTYPDGGDRPEAEFIPGTARNIVSRALADTTGDGFTDAFWFTAPTPVKEGIRQIVAVRVVDNSAQLNANVATRFYRNDTDVTFPPNFDDPRKTKGHTPADLALAGDLQPGFGTNTWNVGFFDNPMNWVPDDPLLPLTPLHYDVERWFHHLDAVGLPHSGDPGTLPHLQLLLETDRLDYWQRAGRHGLRFDPDSVYTPFNLSDEVELRMFHGNNYPWIFSRFEGAVQAEDNPGDHEWFLRAGIGREESTEYLAQLRNIDLVRDNRRKLTLYSGARNDQMPPGLWWGNRVLDLDGNIILPDSVQALVEGEGGIDSPVGFAVQQRFLRQATQKLDLREVQDQYYAYDLTGAPDFGTLDRADAGRLNFRDRLAPTLLLALTDSGAVPEERFVYNSYYGQYAEPFTAATFEVASYDQPDSPLNNTRRLAAAYAANILAYRSNQPATLDDAVPLPAFGDPTGVVGPYLGEGELEPGGPLLSYLPIEPQPFLVEAFVGHVYQARPVPMFHDPLATDPGDCDDEITYANAGQPVVLEGDVEQGASPRATVVAVQIANPFDVPINLGDYVVSVFGMEGPALDGLWLPPATEEEPVTAIFYSLGDMEGDGQPRWREFLDLDVEESDPDAGEDIGLDIVVVGAGDPKHPQGTVLVEVPEWAAAGRDAYDTPAGPHSVVLRRRYFDLGSGETWLDVDHFDSPNGAPGADSFFESVTQMAEYQPESLAPPDVLGGGFQFLGDECSNVPPQDGEFRHGYMLCEDADGNWDDLCTEDHWVQWVRVTRAWGADVNRSGFLEDNERNPRFVFGDAAVVVPTLNGTPDDSFVPGRDTQTGAPLQQGEDDEGNPFETGEEPGGNEFEMTSQKLGTVPWFTRTYYTSAGQLVDGSVDPPRKPTFFNLNYAPGIPLGEYFPDKGWYGQYRMSGVGPPEPGASPVPLDPGAIVLEGVGGVDDPPVIDGATQFLVGPTGPYAENAWTGAALPLFRQPFPMQMTMKNKWLPDGTPLTDLDFEQVGELLNVPLFGHEIDVTAGQTQTTFSEFLSHANAHLSGSAPSLFVAEDDVTAHAAYQDWLLNGHGHRVNRLRLTPLEFTTSIGGAPQEVVVGGLLNHVDPAHFVDIAEYASDVRHSRAALPAGVQVLDAFVCDGPGQSGFDPALDPDPRYFNANAFKGRLTPGLININTAMPEVMRALPHMTRVVHEEFAPGDNPWPQVVEAMLRYRERIGSPVEWENGPAYAHRGRWQEFFASPPITPDNTNDRFIPNMRGSRGFASIGEVNLLTQSGRAGKETGVGGRDDFVYLPGLTGQDAFDAIDGNSAWRIDYPTMPERLRHQADTDAAAEEQVYLYFEDIGGGQLVPRSARISTDVVDVFDQVSGDLVPDAVAEDAQEANLLFAGMSNLITTRSDVFTVYFRIRSFRQNPVTGAWDATDPEYIVDDSRYVMLVDRSEVNHPTDEPKILYLEKLPK